MPGYGTNLSAELFAVSSLNKKTLLLALGLSPLGGHPWGVIGYSYAKWDKCHQLQLASHSSHIQELMRQPPYEDPGGSDSFWCGKKLFQSLVSDKKERWSGHVNNEFEP